MLQRTERKKIYLDFSNNSELTSVKGQIRVGMDSIVLLIFLSNTLMANLLIMSGYVGAVSIET